jgi:hypothetical protein
MKAYKVSVDALRLDERSAYNPQTWNLNIDRMLKYNDVIFYKVDKGNGFEYDRHFCEYTLNDGLRLFASFDYSSSMTNGGFYRLDIEGITNDGKTMKDLYNLVSEGNTEGLKELADEIANATLFNISFNPMYNEAGEKVVIATTPTARQWMIERSTKFNMTFTKGF